MNRRQLLATVAILPLAACAPTPPPSPPIPPPAWLSDLDSILGWLQSKIALLQSILPANLLAKVTAWIAEAQQLVADIVAAVAAGTSPAALVQSAVKIFSDIVAAFTGPGTTLPSWLTAGLDAISTLLPVILAVFGFTARRGALPDGQRIAWARQVLRNR